MRTGIQRARRIFGWGGALTTLLGGVASPVIAQPADARNWPPPGVSFYGDPARPDVSGLWLGTVTGVPGVAFAPNRGPADDRTGTFWAPWPLPYTPAYQKIFDERAAAAKQGRQLGDVTAKCLPFGLPMMLVSKVYPDEIVQTPGEVTFFMNNTLPVIVWTDGRTHPKDLAPSYNGHSIGYWVGDTLFVDTIGLMAISPIDGLRNPHSGKLHVKLDRAARGGRHHPPPRHALRCGCVHDARHHHEHLAAQDRRALAGAGRCLLLRK